MMWGWEGIGKREGGGIEGKEGRGRKGGSPVLRPLFCSHQVFRPKLVQHIRKRKLEKHKKVSSLESGLENDWWKLGAE